MDDKIAALQQERDRLRDDLDEARHEIEKLRQELKTVYNGRNLIERELDEARGLLIWLDQIGGMGIERHERVRAFLSRTAKPEKEK